MKLVADESVDFGIIQILRQHSFDVISISQVQSGISDDEVLEIAVEHQALLLTEDKDFGELVFRLHKPHCGIVLIRLMGLPSNEKAAIVIDSILQHFNDMQYAFTVITHQQTRIRKTI